MKPVTYTRGMLKALRAENLKWPRELLEIAREQWPAAVTQNNFRSAVTNVWRSRDFLVMLFVEPSGCRRLTICRTDIEGAQGRFVENITWDDLQRLKREAGFGAQWCVECYPPDLEIINVQNMRHLFILDETPAFGWHSGRSHR